MSVTEAVRKNKLKKLVASNIGADRYSDALRDQAAYVKDILTGDLEATDGKERKAQRVYYEFYAKYKHRASIIPSIKTKRAYTLWHAVVVAAEKADVEIEKYIAAQFKWFDATFGKIPEPHHMRTEAAIIRAQEFTGTTTKVVERYRSTDNFADVMSEADAQVRNMCRAQKLTRVEFYEKFVVTGIVGFPQQFLDADPAYKQACKKAA